MPIQRLPVVHKFGIISQSKRLDLQQRLAKKVIDESGKSNRPTTSRKSPFAIDEDFVKQFNETEAGSEARQEIETQAERIFLRAKRKTGLQNGGVGRHVNINEAWSELSLLAQCNLRSLQDGALNVLYKSLYYSPISKNHISSLLNLGHASMNWLIDSSSGQPYLRTGELGLIRVTHLVFIRLYYHHRANDIMGFHEERRRLIDIVEAFSDHQDIYRPFPSTLLFLRIIIQISGCLKLALEEELGKSNSSGHHFRMSHPFEKDDVKRRSIPKDEYQEFHEKLKLEASNNSDVTALVNEDHGEEKTGSQRRKESFEEQPFLSLFQEVIQQNAGDRRFSQASSIHNSSPILWHSLNLWRILTHTHQRPDLALKKLIIYRLDLSRSPTLDAIFALHVLCEVAKINHEVLRVMQQIARHDILMVGAEVSEKQTQNKHISRSPEFATQMLNDSLELKPRGWENEYREEGMKYQTSRSKINKGQTGNIGTMDSGTSSSLGFLDHLNEFLNPKPMGVARCEIGHESSSSPVEDEENVDKETILISRMENETEGKDNFTNPLNSINDSGSHLSPINSTESRHVPIGGFCHADNGNHIEAMNSDVESHTSDIASLSDGILADLSSLASDEPHTEYKTRSSKRRIKKKSASHDTVFSSDESIATIKEHELKISSNEDHKRSTSVASLNAPQHQHVPEITSPVYTITRPNTQLGMTITKWPWDVVVSYVTCMGEICLHGSKSKIQSDALIGCHGNEAGLLQFLKFQLELEKGSTMDWSWRVRHVAAQQLMSVCQMTKNVELKDGLQNAAWTSLISHHSTETDRRVLEAYKIARMEANLEKSEDFPTSNTSLYSRISTNLAIIHVAPMVENYDTPRTEFNKLMQGMRLCATRNDEQWGEDLNEQEKSKKIEKLGEGQMSLGCESSKVKKKNENARVSIRNEITLATSLDHGSIPSLVKRSWKNVQSIAEDQWKKEMVEEYEIVEKQRQDIMNKEIERIRHSIPKQSLKERIKF